MGRIPLTSEVIALIAERFKALAEPARLRIMAVLMEGERTVGELVDATALSQANVSKHLRVLHGQGFVERRRAGLHVRYRLADHDVVALCDTMCARIEREHALRGRLIARGA
jgi:DNA-binding transcriptional ArsR family regulator